MIIGHQKQWNFLKNAVENDKLSHAYLFSGPEKLGKKTLALELASYIFKSPLKNHPDFIFIEPEKKEIQISQIKGLIRSLSFKPSLSPIKIAVIDNAHLMNQEAQTSLLKTLEEPRGKVSLILVSHNPQYLFSTIISRVQVVKFNPVNKENIKKHILNSKPLTKEEAERISEISMGRPGKAIELSSSKKEIENFDETVKDLNRISKSFFCSRFKYAKDLTEDTEDLDKLRDVLEIWIYYYRNIFLNNQTTKTKNIINLIEKTKNLIFSTNINPRLAMEKLVIEL